jgi:hypothetical protein
VAQCSLSRCEWAHVTAIIAGSRIRSWIVKRWQACCLAVELAVWPGWSIALAEAIPSPDALEQLSARPVTLSVIEPHLSTPEHPLAVDYLAFPAPVVISAALGPEWEAKTKTIEFRALDGYVSRIDLARLANGRSTWPSLAPTDPLHGR